MARFRKKPVVVEAVRVREVLAARGGEQWSALPDWVRAAHAGGDLGFVDDGSVVVKTLEGAMVGGADDWLIRGVAGEIYPCRGDIFEATYEPAR